MRDPTTPERAAIRALEAAGHEVMVSQSERGVYVSVDGHSSDGSTFWSALIAAAQKAAGSAETLAPDLEGVLEGLESLAHEAQFGEVGPAVVGPDLRQIAQEVRAHLKGEKE